MLDRLDHLGDLLTRLSRVPGLGFLENYSDSLLQLKHNVDDQLGEFDEKKQGFEEGVEILGEATLFKRKGAESSRLTANDPAAGESALESARSKAVRSKIDSVGKPIYGKSGKAHGLKGKPASDTRALKAKQKWAKKNAKGKS